MSARVAYNSSRPDEPIIRLAAATVSRACFELEGRDPIAACDALIWLITDASYWLECANLVLEPDEIFERILKMEVPRGGKNIGYAEGTNRKLKQKRAATLSQDTDSDMAGIHIAGGKRGQEDDDS